MMAWRVHEFGPPNVMRFERVPRPNPGPSEVLVKVEAAGVGPWDGWIRAGKSALPQPLPLTLGSDLSGEIVAVGPGVSDLRVGDQVYGVTNPRFIGAYAEYALAFAAMVSRKPTSLTYIEAASVPVIAVTAWQALFDQAQLTAGQTVVIHGAAGNVGAYAVQLARRAGVRTIATAATDDIPAEIARLVDGGQLSTRVGAVLPLADAREAHFMLERVRPQPKGKIVLTVGAS
jgi:NADPH:quinone reductase-like Zn-dependent oxidoreductase